MRIDGTFKNDYSNLTIQNTSQISHNLILEKRRELSLSGVYDVNRFDDKQISIYTKSMGCLIVFGVGLKLNSFNKKTGDLKIVGERIDKLIYSNSNKYYTASGFFSKLFK